MSSASLHSFIWYAVWDKDGVKHCSQIKGQVMIKPAEPDEDDSAEPGAVIESTGNKGVLTVPSDLVSF